jgi:hypothetical protein
MLRYKGRDKHLVLPKNQNLNLVNSSAEPTVLHFIAKPS